MIILILQKQTFSDLIDRSGILSQTQNSILKCYFTRDLMIPFNAVKKTENRAFIFKYTEFYKCHNKKFTTGTVLSDSTGARTGICRG